MELIKDGYGNSFNPVGMPQLPSFFGWCKMVKDHQTDEAILRAEYYALQSLLEGEAGDYWKSADVRDSINMSRRYGKKII